MPDQLIAVGVSACLLGEKVRYDGGDKYDRQLVENLGRYFRLVPVCPEVESGMTVPREPMRLEGEPAAPRLVTHQSRRDLTDQMLAYCRAKQPWLAQQGLSGFVFKSKSPSSGPWKVPVHSPGGTQHSASGLFAGAVLRQFPLLPVEEEGRLQDQELREGFIERVFAYRRWQDFCRQDGSLGGLVSFHARHKYQLQAHHPVQYRELGRLVATGSSLAPTELLDRYGFGFMRCLGYQATVKKNTDVLLHLLGYFKKQLGGEEKAELLEMIDDYRRTLVPLMVPLVLIRHYVRRLGEPYLREQTYLAPLTVERNPACRTHLAPGGESAGN